jgi:hypothetical protein
MPFQWHLALPVKGKKLCDPLSHVKSNILFNLSIEGHLLGKKKVETLQSFIKKTHPRLGKCIKGKEKQEIIGHQGGSK